MPRVANSADYSHREISRPLGLPFHRGKRCGRLSASCLPSSPARRGPFSAFVLQPRTGRPFEGSRAILHSQGIQPRLSAAHSRFHSSSHESPCHLVPVLPARDKARKWKGGAGVGGGAAGAPVAPGAWVGSGLSLRGGWGRQEGARPLPRTGARTTPLWGWEVPAGRTVPWVGDLGWCH